jgi:hypothetical protein
MESADREKARTGKGADLESGEGPPTIRIEVRSYRPFVELCKILWILYCIKKNVRRKIDTCYLLR